MLKKGKIMKTNTLKLTALGILFSGFTMAQNKFEVNPSEEFTKLVISGSVEVEINSGKTCGFISYGSSDSKYVYVKDQVLNISQKNDSKMKVVVNCNSLSEIVMSGSGDCRTNDTLFAENFKLVIAGSGDADLMLSVKQLNTVVSGSADVKIKGVAEEHNAVVSGSGDLYAIDLKTKTANATISGTGDARINPSDNLTAVVSGTGGIFYKDEPINKSIKTSGNGEVEKIGSYNSESGKGDTSRVKIGRYKFIIIPDGKDAEDTTVIVSKDNYHHWAGFDLGANMMFNEYNEFKAPGGHPYLELNTGKSFNYKFNFFEANFNLYQEKINIVTGGGFEWSRFGISKNYELFGFSDSVKATQMPYKFAKNQLRTTWVTAPLLLEFNTSNNEDKSFHAAAGVVGGFRLGTKYIEEYVSNGKEYSFKTRDNFNLNSFKLDAMVRVGYGKYTAWAGYNLTGLFKKGTGPVAYPLTVGITLVPFN